MSLRWKFAAVATSVLIFFMTTMSYAAETKKTASDPADDQQMGKSVSISDTILVVGAHGDNSRTGAAYIYYRNQGGPDNWGQLIKITAADGESDDRFGFSVAIYDTIIVVGASRENANGTRAGAAYVFYKNQGGADNWGQIQKIIADDGQPYAYFGTSVEIYDTFIMIGADGDTVADSTDAGSAYIYYKDNGGVDNWGEQAKLNSSDFGADDNFGNAVAIGPDWAIVGAYRDDSPSGGDKGKAYIFARNQGGADNWGEYLQLEPTIAGVSQFGASVDIDGDYIAVGAPRDDELVQSSGAVYVYYRNQDGINAWGLQQKVKADTPVEDSQMAGGNQGNTVAINGNFLLAGAPFETVGSNMWQGAIYAFIRNGDTWTQTSRETADDGAAEDGFGVSVSVNNYFSVAGSLFNEHSGFTDPGAFYIYDSGGDLSLPVELVSFSAEICESGIRLDWQSASELENVGYILYRNQGETEDFEEIDSYKYDDNLIGLINSSSGKTYSYIDSDVKSGVQYRYMLGDVNLSGRISTHEPVEISYQATLAAHLSIAASPNPFNPETVIRIENPGTNDYNGKTELVIFDILGRKIKTLYSGYPQPGNYNFTWNGTNDFGVEVATGVYFAVISHLATSELKSLKLIYLK